ncbi:MAG: protein rep, partial [Candidatus Binatia bacterium]
MRSFHRMEKPLSQLEHARYLVLTERNVPLGSLDDGLTHLFNSFERLRHRRVWKWVRGAVVALEVTFNRQQRTWHPHLNVIFDGAFLPQKDLADNWRVATEGRGKIVWVEEAKGPKTALEVFKYVTKLADIADVPDAVVEFLAATHGLRFLRTYGTLYRLPEEEEFELSCPDCGTHEVRRIGFVPFEAVSLDAQGVLRFDSALLIGVESPPQFDTGP